MHYVAVIAIVFGLFAGSANAQQRASCGVYEKMVDQLATKYKEYKRVVGISSKTQIVEVYMADDGSTFTVLIRNAGPIGCMVVSGQQVYILDKKPRPKRRTKM